MRRILVFLCSTMSTSYTFAQSDLEHESMLAAQLPTKLIAFLTVVLIGTIVYRVRRFLNRPFEPVELIQLYPNPANDIIHVDYNGVPGPILIYNIMGHQVKTFYGSGDNHEFDVSDLPVGTYFLLMRGFFYETDPEKFRIVR